MDKLKTALTCFLSVCIFTLSFSQTRKISGDVVSAKDGSILVGATVNQKGTSNSTSTDAEGKFSLNVPASRVTLLITSVGFNPKEVEIPTGSNTITIDLTESSQELTGVVVTALGIVRKEKSLTYSTQVIGGDQVSAVKDANMMNGLIGKVSGLQINKSSSGVGGSVNVTLRGLKSLRNNQPLYIIDGLPIVNTGGSGPTGPFGGNTTDQGDILSTLNPDDIQSISVLKGASASALYGSEGANGAIMITTKKGSAGDTKIAVSSSTMFDRAFLLPDLQYTYKQSPSSNNDAEESWGPKGDFSNLKNMVKDFFQTGKTLINSVALSGGNSKSRNYFSYANTANWGIVPTSKFDQHTLSFKNQTNFFQDKLEFSGSLMYSSQKIHNRPTDGLYFNQTTGVYMFPRGLDWNEYKDNWEYFSPSRNLWLQNWFEINYDNGMSGTHHTQNPYWVINKIPVDQKRDNLIGAIDLKYKLTDWLYVKARGTINRDWNHYQRTAYAGTQGVLSGTTSSGLPVDNGRYIRADNESTNLYGDLLLVGSRELSGDLALNFTAGSSIQDMRLTGWDIDARKLKVANAFLLSGVYLGEPNTINDLNENFDRAQAQGVFGSANVGYKDRVFVDLTARNDWSSTLANTPSAKSGFFYWSAGISFVLSDILKLPSWNNLSKLRFTYAEVGNGIGDFVSIIPQATINTGNIVVNNSGLFKDIPLKPELSRSFELGYEGRFIDNRLSLDLAVYKSNTINQYVSFSGPSGLLNTTLYLNAGNIQNKGLEAALNYTIVRNGSLEWISGLNITANRNKVLKLNPNLGNTYPLNNFSVLRVGGSFGDFWAKRFLRDDNGKIMVGDDGTPLSTTDGYIGTQNPKALIGWSNSFTIGKLGILLNVDGRFGGQVISTTMGYLNSFGYSKESADARDAGGVKVDAVKKSDGSKVSIIDAQRWYEGVGNRDGIIEGQIYSATNIRLRELSVSYDIPLRSNTIRTLSFALVGRNLFFFKNNAPYDPELTNSTVGGSLGYDSFGLPTTRSIGFNLKFTL